MHNCCQYIYRKLITNMYYTENLSYAIYLAFISCAMPPTMRLFNTRLRSSSCWIACCAARTRLSVARLTAFPAACIEINKYFITIQ